MKDRGLARDLYWQLLRLWKALAGNNLLANVKFAMELQGHLGGFPRADGAQLRGATDGDPGCAAELEII
jgi:hypothetical protein